MPPMVRSILVVLAGVVTSALVVVGTDAIVSSLHPLPPGIDVTNQESLRQAMATIPASAFVVLLAGWLVAAAVGSFVAARWAGRAPVMHGVLVALILLAATVANLVAVPHPTWMWPAVLILIPLAGWAGVRIARPRPAATGA